MGNLAGNAVLPKNGSQQGTTQSVIGPAQITITGSGDAVQDEQSRQTAALLASRDPKTANGSLKNTLTLQQAQVLQAEIKKQQENMEAAKLVGAVLSNVVGDAAKKNNWAEDSPQKIALHGLVGLIEAKIGGGDALAGILGGIGQEVMAPILSDYLKKNGFDYGEPGLGKDEAIKRKAEYDSLMQLGATLTGTAVGALASGNIKGSSTAANAAFVGVTNNYLSHPENTLRAKAKQDLKNCADDACKQQAQAEIDKWNAEDARRDAEFHVACDGALSSTPGCADATSDLFKKLETYAVADARNAASNDKVSDLTKAHKDELQSYLDLIKVSNPEVKTSSEDKVRDPSPSKYNSDAYGVIDRDNVKNTYLVMKFGTEALTIANTYVDGEYWFTPFAFRNGQSNEPGYAPGLGLAHVDAAALTKNNNENSGTPYIPIDRFTLSYAPTDGGLLDTLGTAVSKMGIDSAPILALRDQLQLNQASGQTVYWVAHSRGGEDFAQAASGAASGFLDMNKVVFHAGANTKFMTEPILDAKRIDYFNGGYRDSPNDLVPQFVGFRALTSPLNFLTALFSAPCVFLCSAENSPHTLPYDWPNLLKE